MSYSNISNFGPNGYNPVNNPLTYCIGSNMEQRFLHGGQADTFGQDSGKCQLYLSDYCAKNWDGFCEIASKNTDSHYPNSAGGCNGNFCPSPSNSGDILLYNTAARKYLNKMHNAEKKREPFDPTVANSPMVSYWMGPYKIPEYTVNPSTIDNDIVMNKILDNPTVAVDILINIFNTMKRYNTVYKLKGTRLGNFYDSHRYFIQRGGTSEQKQA